MAASRAAAAPWAVEVASRAVVAAGASTAEAVVEVHAVAEAAVTDNQNRND